MIQFEEDIKDNEIRIIGDGQAASPTHKPHKGCFWLLTSCRRIG